MDAKFEIERLRTVLNQAGYEYYVMDNPTMSDYDYDHKLRRLEELEAQFSYLGKSFRHKVSRCPMCGQICLSEELVTGRMSEVESMMEDK